jgi:hypothetical protein
VEAIKVISTSQIRNVLRVYGNDLKKRTMILQENREEKDAPPDSISISEEARKKEVMSKISNNIVSQITRNDYRKDNL